MLYLTDFVIYIVPFSYMKMGKLRRIKGAGHGCETWSLKLREKHRLRVFENRVLRRIFGPKRGDVTGDWRKLHNLYSSPNIIRM
jgi:hypothetical protein